MPANRSMKSFIDIVYDYIDNPNATVDMDLQKPFVKLSLRHVYPLFIMLHACVCLGGTLGNGAMLYTIWRRRRRRRQDPTLVYLANLALADLVKAALVLPLTIATLVMANWIFGSFLCYLVPMLQAFPLHASMLTYTVLALDRHRLIAYPIKSRIPAKLCMAGVWLASVCVVLPYVVYIDYMDLGAILGPHFERLGICFVNMERNIQEYIRAVFVVMYCLPLAVIAFLYVRVSGELKSSEPLTSLSIHFDGLSESHTTMTTTTTTTTTTTCHDDAVSGRRRSTVTSEDVDDVMVDVRKERRTQKYLVATVLLYALSWFPLNILTLVTHFVYENDDNGAHFDVTYLTFTFFGFLSTCVNPVMFASWYLSDQTKDRLRGYFRFSNRRSRQGLTRHRMTSTRTLHLTSRATRGTSTEEVTYVRENADVHDNGTMSHGAERQCPVVYVESDSKT